MPELFPAPGTAEGIGRERPANERQTLGGTRIHPSFIPAKRTGAISHLRFGCTRGGPSPAASGGSAASEECGAERSREIAELRGEHRGRPGGDEQAGLH